MKNILVTGMTSNIGGLEIFFMNYYRRINPQAIHFDLWCNYPSFAFEREMVSHGSRVYHGCARSKDPLKGWKDIRRFFQEHGQEYDAVWSNKNTLTNMDDLRLAKACGIPKRILHSHNVQTEGTGAKVFLRDVLHCLHRSSICSLATDYWACTDAGAAWFYGRDAYLRTHYQLIHNAIDTRIFRYDPEVRTRFRKQLGLEDAYVLGNVGRFSPQKNHAFLLEIFHAVCERNAQARLVLVGTGELEPQIRSRVRELSLESRVHFLGLRNDVAQLLQAMDAFVFPSQFEGLGISLIEAQAVGLPTFASQNVIPKDAKQTDLLHFIPLSASPETWVEQILSHSAVERRDYSGEIQRAGYDIVENASWLEKRFME